MIRFLFPFTLLILLCSCSSVTTTLKYGYLPGSDYEYYAPISKVDLKGKKYNIVLVDDRAGNNISCYDRQLPRDTELEGEAGLSYFRNYLKAMIEFNNGAVDASGEILKVRLKALSGDLRMVGYGHVYGLIEFEASRGSDYENYCSAMVDGDEDAPLGKFSFDTRKGAFRKMVSASTRRALEQLMHDLQPPGTQ